MGSFGAALLVFGGVALVMTTHMVQAKGELEAAIPMAAAVQKQLVAGDNEAAALSARKLESHTKKAAGATGGRLWRALEWVPVAGPNLAAVRVAAVAVNDLAVNAVVPATGLSIDQLKPVHGRINLEALAAMEGTVQAANASANRASAQLARVDRAGLFGPVEAGIARLDSGLGQVGGLLDGLEKTVKVLPGALGAEGPRNYLMLFQSNAESRGTGGNPAAMVLLTAEDGKISISQQASSTDFVNARPKPIIPLDRETEALYGDKIGRWIPDMTLTPDFPFTVKLAKAYWAESFGTRVDGVISFDPVALSYLLGATGPVTLATGDTLTAENAVPLLLNEVYFRYEDPKVQDVFFAAAAASVFDAITSGVGDTGALVQQLTRATDEGRLMYWTDDKSQSKILAGTRLTGTLPTDNANATVVGAYINDNTGSKMDYYLDVTNDVTSTQCQARKPVLTGSVTLTSTINAADARHLPAYIAGVNFRPGDISTDVVLYGPVGATIDSVQVNGHKVKPSYSGQHLGRPAVKVRVFNVPGAVRKISYTMTGAPGKYGPLEVHGTPMVRPTPVTLSTPGCMQ
ncbi:Protein of unknown function [Cryobacterium psychrotolerans]|uniref:DUF4012 domain-containing protein n=1 Tax=Cryobacterium psychrotolerans TaxID=386301 RepID=A0A1G9BVJ1_9MICO|nr:MULTISPECIES: DUF4012 domain-containing protein [Cryobacterium]SDK43400.1 Protein of unknown function [Cryobacterium psychrotolerans]